MVTEQTTIIIEPAKPDVVYVPTLKARPGRLNMEVLVVMLTAISAAAVVFTVIQNQDGN